MNSNVKERIAFFCLDQKISRREFERRIGASNGFVNSISKGIGADKMAAIRAQFPTLNPTWLLYGEGDMYLGENSISGNNFQSIDTNNGVVNQSNGSEQCQNEEKGLYQKIVSLLEQQIEQLKEEKRNFLERIGCSSYEEVSKKLDDLEKGK